MKKFVASQIIIVWVVMIAESSGNSGTDFIVSFPNNKYPKTPDPIDLYVSSTVGHIVTVNITAPKFLDFEVNISFALLPESSRHFEIDEKFRMPAGTSISPRTLVITASGLIDVVGVNLYNSNGDAFLAIPNRFLGNEYMAVTYESEREDAFAFLTVSAGTGSDQTQLSITFPPWTGNESVLLNGTWYRAGESAPLSLNSLETLQIQSKHDLTGAYITSDQPVAVYSGVNRTDVVYTRCVSHLLDQMPPVDRAGMSYVTIPFPKRELGDVYRIVATTDDTVVSVPNSANVNLAKRGDFHEMYVSPFTFYYVTATKPVFVVHISVSVENFKYTYGDPSLVILTPIERAYVGTSFSRASYTLSYVTIVMLKQDKAGMMFDHEPLPADQEWFLVEGSDSYTATQVLVGANYKQHIIYHSGAATFVAYFHTGTSCEAQAMSLGFSLGANKTLVAAMQLVGNYEDYASPIERRINISVTSSHANPSYPILPHPSCWHLRRMWYIHFAYIVKSCEAPTNVPGDGLDNDCDGRIDEETCCMNLQPADNDGDGRFNEDCAGVSVNGTTKAVCCDSIGNIIGSKLASVSVLFGKPEVGTRRLATSLLKYSAHAITACAQLCEQKQNCWGMNFDSTRSVQNCEILAGLKGGTQQQSPWNFWDVSSRTYGCS
ncbi:uncharacterized protein LOC121389830 [Gigantopelta aegis]|uniref:uncharacterized protein LOC121389830 n=1 Tax=Gigantopelta aegis TaxID=1735272 RepID=UPI001B889B27|nr:uncharacterized protein LOC121389830 [Gigantopelta aegis]